ncbi:MAG: response regulator [Thermodesulfobacteriota bacterium]|nr:response regulator [Thermodesulfobacteriota bacterium]
MMYDPHESQVEVLFVDDEPDILRALKRLFVDEEYAVYTASSGMKGIEVIKDNPGIGVIVSDQRMPELTGIEFLEKTRKIRPMAVRILLTAYSDVNASIDAINRGGAYRYITKPWKNDELVQTIGEARQRYALIQENKRLDRIVKKQNKELKHWNTQLEQDVQKQTMELSRQNDELKRLSLIQKNTIKEMIGAFSGLIELRNPSMINHSRNVAKIAVRAARAMKLSVKEVESITIAALLHDMGKIGIPDTILFKAFKDMDDEEKKEYKLHPIRGQAVLDSIEGLRSAGVFVRHHHEAFDGTGFPDGLEKAQIPTGAAIIAVADFVDHDVKMSAGKNAVSHALNHVRERLGSMFDPRIYPFIDNALTHLDIYTKDAREDGTIEVELIALDLREGMVLSRDVKSGTGLLLMRRGTILDKSRIHTLMRYARLDPSRKGVFVRIRQ